MNMRAIDLYAGIGGWSLGLRLAGLDVVASYEWWQPAVDTHNGNHDTELEITNIRELELSDLPKNIDVVVGSPPCTQFSYSNRGGSGDVEDGLVDLVKYFEIVSYLKPKFWAMENVPRVAKVIQQGFLDEEHVLYKYRHLKPNIAIFDFSEFGTPQARKRCIATNIPISKIRAFSTGISRVTLGDVVTSLAQEGNVHDPVWGRIIGREHLTETETEEYLNSEELRINRDAKTYHPIYNNMAFPDRLTTPARTVTATCTRVSRESIVIGENDEFRRLSVRERASLQGFPITYQFFGKSFAAKTKMIGNAIPPNFTYLVASIMMGVSTKNFIGFHNVADKLDLPLKTSLVTKPDKPGRSYPNNRRFRAAIPMLRFKSGMRFDLANTFSDCVISWNVKFYSGDSKSIDIHDLGAEHLKSIKKEPSLSSLWERMPSFVEVLERQLNSTSMQEVQDVWTHKKIGFSPFDFVDVIGEVANEVHLNLVEVLKKDEIELLVMNYIGVLNKDSKIKNETKLKLNASRILSGILTGVWLNSYEWDVKTRQAA